MKLLDLTSSFVTDILSKIITKTLHTKLGKNVDIDINDAYVSIENGKLDIHLDIDASMNKDDLLPLLKKFNIL